MVGVVFGMPKRCRLAENLYCKVVPAQVSAFVGSVLDAVTIRLYHICQQTRQIRGISRRTDLVIYDSQPFVVFTEAQHGFDKIVSMRTEYPGDTDDKIMF